MAPLRDTAQLFAAASASGRIVELDVACIEQVLLAARAIGPDRLLTLNLSPRTLEVRDFDAGWLLQGLYRNGISPGRVIVELTERDEIDDLARLKRTFQHLRQYGLRIAADDVGAGNAGLRLLSQVQFDIVKLDLSLVQDGVRRMGARSVLQSLRDLALDQHAHVVAEGVETAEQLNVLRDLQIGAGQGYLLGRPGASVSGTFVDVDTLSDITPRAAVDGAARVRHAGARCSAMARPCRPTLPRRTCAPSSCRCRAWAAWWGARPAPPDPVRGRRPAAQATRKPVPLPSWRARRKAPSARPSAMTARSAREPGPSARRAERTLGTMPPAMTPRR